jgi:hypothetical protein
MNDGVNDALLDKALTAVQAFETLEKACQECVVAFGECGLFEMANMWAKARGGIVVIASAVMEAYQRQNDLLGGGGIEGKKPRYDA